MSKLVVSSEIAKSLTEKNKLNYFKRELIKILEKSDEIVEKAGYGIGVVRVWKGEKYRKIAPGKWRKIYESNTRGARQSINIIRKKIQNAASTDELLQIVMENTNRFMDAEGKLLPIVEELKRAVNESKGKLNAGKPSTQEQIDKFKKENGKSEEDQYSEDIKEIDAALGSIPYFDRNDEGKELSLFKKSVHSSAVSRTKPKCSISYFSIATSLFLRTKRELSRNCMISKPVPTHLI